MRWTVANRLWLVVGLTLASQLLMAVVDVLSVGQIRRELAGIEESYVPLLELSNEAGTRFDRLRRMLQDAVAAQDLEELEGTRAQKDELQRRLSAAPTMVDRGELAAAQRAIEEWYALAYEVSRRLIVGEAGEELVEAIEQMQASQRAALAQLESAVRLDRQQLANAFELVREAQDVASWVRMIVRILLALLLALLALGVARQIVRSVQELTGGLRRFGRGEFEEPIRLEGSDEFAQIADQANHMAASLLELDARLRRRQQELERANAELEAFSYSVSHDLRAPLRGIDGFSQALLEDYGESLPEPGQDYLRRVRAAAQRMAQLIDDMLQLSRVTRGAMKREKVDLSSLAQEVAQDLARTAPPREVEWIIQPGLTALGDARLLRAVLENLLGNAWKFTARVERPRIEFGATRREGEQVFFVRDNGAGFDMKYVGKLFSAFQRLHGANEFPGTGVGLATVQRVIHRHGGRTWAEGEIGRGATFYFSLPEQAEG